jgi:hypothetical protein
MPSLTNDAGTACLGNGSTSFTGVDVFSADWPAQGNYWSSGSYEGNRSSGIGPSVAWFVVLDFRIVLHVGLFVASKANDFSVWPVRGGQ